MKGLVVNEHIFNQLIRVYAGACLVPDTKYEHIDMFVKDGMDLFREMEQSPDVDINI